MNWFDTLRDSVGGLASGLAPGQRSRVSAWRKLPVADLGQKHERTRYVVVDVEASGLNAEKDRLISIGAVAVRGGLIDSADSFEVVLRQDQVSDAKNILVHGIGASAQREGVDPAEGLLSFLEFAGKAPLVAYHAFFDQAMIERAAQEALGFRPDFAWIDLAWILPELFAGDADPATSLDQWLNRYSITNHQRHNAVSDAYATAQLLQMSLAKAAMAGDDTSARLIALERARRRLRRA